MRKVLAIITILICVGIYYYYMKGGNFVKEEKVTAFDTIIELSAKEENFRTPEDLIRMNNRIISYLYGGEVQTEEIQSLLSIQRSLFDSQLLEINPLEVQVEKVSSKIEEYKEKGFKIIEIKQKSTEYKEEDTSIASIKVIQYTNGEHDNYLEYYLRKQIDNTWRILGWKMIDEFDIAEELEL